MAVLVQKLAAMRTQEEVGRSQIILAKQKLNEGIALYNEKRFTDSIPVLQTAFSLNPGDPQALNYLRLAQQEEQKIQAAKFAREFRQGSTTAGVTTTGPKGGTQVGGGSSTGAAQLTTVFTHPFVDGYMIIKAGSDIVLQENLYVDGRGIFRRRSPRPLNVTREVPPKNADMDIWVIVKSQNINEHRRIAHNFRPGSNQRLEITYNAQTKKFDYQLN